MDFVKISPKRMFRSMSKKSRWMSRSKPPSFISRISSASSSSSSDFSSSTHLKGGSGDPGTLASVLPSHPQQAVSGDWSDLSADKNLEIVQTFKLLDRDGDGKITRQELEALLVRLGLEPESEEELSMMLMDIDQLRWGWVYFLGRVQCHKYDL